MGPVAERRERAAGAGEAQAKLHSRNSNQRATSSPTDAHHVAQHISTF